MRIGAALADARWRAHLTVDEVSHRTRIREAIIWGIEQDDFSACGGDAYARGHIRAIAQAVGTDPDPLIAQYDQTYRTNEDIDDVVALKPPPPPGRPPKPHRRGVLAGSATLGVVVLAVVAWAIYHVASGVSHPEHSQDLAASGHSSSSRASGAAADGQGSPQPSPALTTPSPVPTTPSPTPTPADSTPPPAPASRALPVAGAVPFGPGGEGSGDNAQSAHLATDSLYSTGWHSDWYTTAALGNLKPGTGLLLDLGRRVTINDAQLDLGGSSGADIQLRAGNSVSPGDLHEVASVNGAGTRITVNLKTPARAKYLLIWFTQLPPDGNGTYQAAVYHVIVRGHS
jgi:cytoskeletal protein RodZ